MLEIAPYFGISAVIGDWLCRHGQALKSGLQQHRFYLVLMTPYKRKGRNTDRAAAWERRGA